jgi:hypothetical protein
VPEVETGEEGELILYVGRVRKEVEGLMSGWPIKKGNICRGMRGMRDKDCIKDRRREW